MNISGETIGLAITIIGSAIAVSTWVTVRITKLETKMDHAFFRIAALEKKKSPQPPAAMPVARRKRK